MNKNEIAVKVFIINRGTKEMSLVEIYLLLGHSFFSQAVG